MAPGQQAGGPPASLALLHAIARRDLPAVKRTLAAGVELQWKGISALHLCALCGWAKAVPLLLSHGADVNAWEKLAPSGSVLDRSVALAHLESIGVPYQLCTAAFPLHEPSTPLQLAVLCGAAAAASALLREGASTGGAYSQLAALARWKALQLGPAAAARLVPEAVQECAAALLAAPLHALTEAHTSAVQLAFPHAAGEEDPYPHGSLPACPWLLQQLLQRHSAGQIPRSSAAVWAVCNTLLACADQREQSGPYDDSELVAALAAWLSLPAARGITGSNLARMLKQVCQLRLTGALPALLALPPMREALRAEAALPVAAEEGAVVQSAELVCAAADCGAEVLDAVLAAGGAVTLNAINSAVCHAADAVDVRALRSLRLLLSRGRPPVPLDAALITGPDAAEYGYLACPVYAVLDNFKVDAQMLVDNLMMEAGHVGRPPGEGPLQLLHARALEVMEVLADAGYQPCTFTKYGTPDDLWSQHEQRSVGPRSFCPAEDAAMAARWELGTSGRWLWLAARREPWSPERHAAFPPAFKQAACTLLLAAHRGASAAGAVQQRGSRRSSTRRASTRSRGTRRRAAGSAVSSTADAGAGAAQLARLPRELLHAILAQAAYPVSAWRPQMEGGQALVAVRTWQPPPHFVDEDLYSDEEGFSDGDEEFSDGDESEWEI